MTGKETFLPILVDALPIPCPFKADKSFVDVRRLQRQMKGGTAGRYLMLDHPRQGLVVATF